MKTKFEMSNFTFINENILDLFSSTSRNLHIFSDIKTVSELKLLNVHNRRRSKAYTYAYTYTFKSVADQNYARPSTLTCEV